MKSAPESSSKSMPVESIFWKASKAMKDKQLNVSQQHAPAAQEVM